MEKALQVFEFEGKRTRVVMVDGEPWFVAKDVAYILDFEDSTHATRSLDTDEKGVQKGRPLEEIRTWLAFPNKVFTFS